MYQNGIDDLIELGWTDEKIKELTGCDDEYLERMKENEESRDRIHL
jgi:hypothetical protein